MFNVFGNSSANDTVQWQPEPTARGTFGVLSTCLITISLCIWTAVHLNVPCHKGGIKQTIRKVKWLVIGLLAPELVLFTAWYQYIRARQTAVRIFELYQKRQLDIEGGTGTEEVKWNVKQGFYINMGGLAFDTSTAKGQFLPMDCNQWCFIAPSGADILAKLHPEILDSITASHVEDKNKTSGFGKTLVCLQTLWFMAQCTGRLIRGLPICLLELNTFGHCICALVIYVLWWQKPLDVERPTIIAAERYPETLAVLWMSSFPSPNSTSGHSERSEVRLRVNRLTPSKPLQDPHMQYPSQHDLPSMNTSNEAAEITLRSGEELLDTGIHYRPDGPPLKLDRISVERWRLASSFLRTHHMYRNYLTPLENRISNWEFPSNLTPENKWLAWAILLFTSFIYGGFHVLAWQVPFRTSAQQMLWRISASVVMGYGFILCGHSLFLQLDEKDLGKYQRMRTHKLFSMYYTDRFWAERWFFTQNLVKNMSRLLKLKRYPYVYLAWPATVFYVVCFAISWVAVSAGALVYLAARIFLVVECFLSLFNSPADLYKQPSWAPYFPHIG